MTDALCACQAVLAGLRRGIRAFITHGTTQLSSPQDRLHIYVPYFEDPSVEDRQRRRDLSVAGE